MTSSTLHPSWCWSTACLNRPATTTPATSPFGNDGMLYVVDRRRRLRLRRRQRLRRRPTTPRATAHVLLGKILRITRDRRDAAGQPLRRARAPRGCNHRRHHNGQPGARRSSPGACATRSAWPSIPTPPATRFFINDVGQSAWEEIDLGRGRRRLRLERPRGALRDRLDHDDCGSPPPAGMTDPIFDYGRTRRLRLDHRWRLRAERRLAQRLRRRLPVQRLRLRPDLPAEPNGSGGFTRTDFATGLGGSSAVHLLFARPAALYYTTYANGGQVQRDHVDGDERGADGPDDCDPDERRRAADGRLRRIRLDGPRQRRPHLRVAMGRRHAGCHHDHGDDESRVRIPRHVHGVPHRARHLRHALAGSGDDDRHRVVRRQPAAHGRDHGTAGGCPVRRRSAGHRRRLGERSRRRSGDAVVDRQPAPRRRSAHVPHAPDHERERPISHLHLPDP